MTTCLSTIPKRTFSSTRICLFLAQTPPDGPPKYPEHPWVNFRIFQSFTFFDSLKGKLSSQIGSKPIHYSPKIEQGAKFAFGHFVDMYKGNSWKHLVTPEYCSHLERQPRVDIELLNIHSLNVVYSKPRIGDPQYWKMVLSQDEEKIKQLRREYAFLTLFYLSYGTVFVLFPQKLPWSNLRYFMEECISTVAEFPPQRVVDVELNATFNEPWGRRNVYIRFTTDWKDDDTWSIADIDYQLEKRLEDFLDVHFLPTLAVARILLPL